jgi:REP element-mobilizing transposase RayT
MSRRHRVQYPDAIYHVASRGVNRADIFWDDEDRQCFLERMSQTVAKFGWLVYAFALMTNHFHWFFRTPDPDLCRGMQYLLGQYAGRFNRRHRRSGHLFQGRFRCKVIEDETYHWSVSRYVHLNPTPALAMHPAQWPWSSYPGFCDPSQRLPWVRYDDVLASWQGAFGGDLAVGYREFVEAGLASNK